MLVLYYVVEDVQVTNTADVNRKELVLELCIFCFQAIASFWVSLIVLAIGFERGFRRYSIWLQRFMAVSGSLTTLAIVCFLYYRCLISVQEIASLNEDLTKE